MRISSSCMLASPGSSAGLRQQFVRKWTNGNEAPIGSKVPVLAYANGIAPRSFASVLGLGNGIWSARLDLQLSRHVAARLGEQTGVTPEAISAMALNGGALTPLLLPLRKNARRRRSTWMQYCPLCLADDERHQCRRSVRVRPLDRTHPIRSSARQIGGQGPRPTRPSQRKAETLCSRRPRWWHEHFCSRQEIRRQPADHHACQG
ncbi:MAG: TniQ family protein [Rhizobiaceae bacterium]|nr:TniQ family protein [Rhizobiaceae bacterium]